ncbi:YfcC family protein [Peptoniphilus sp. AGMB00490]|uniref:YfcC family protein n=1 Tax=Peptoniphilus faecalis TaxID=2731255 RepID=A0A848RIN6_9FIRM|nr:TIGR00366 family protein [Peptoniphilus faecalis]NMW85671.1 YfcC family protein [Peptoniphilus faecalis]
MKKKFELPHIYVLLGLIIVICAILTWILPTGEFIREANEAGIEVAVPGTYHIVEKSPVGFFATLQSFYKGMVDAGPVIFFVFISYSAIGLILETGAINGLIANILRNSKDKTQIMIVPIFITLIGIISSTIGVFEEMMPFIPVFAGICVAMGYDTIVGMAIVALGTAVGYSGAVVNPFTVGMAQSIAELPQLSGAWYRIICHIVMIIVTSLYVVKYARKIRLDPTKSLIYGDDSKHIITNEEMMNYKFEIREKIVLLILAIGIATIVYGSYNFGWYFNETNAVFLLMGILSAIVMGWNFNKIAESIAKNFTDIAMACMMIGIARGILIVLKDGNIIDTIVYGLSIPLSYLPKVLMGPAMLIFQTLLNFFIPSGSGQAVTSMPIMAPLSDLLGISRQIAVLAFQFGDGFSNIVWPTAFAPIICGIAGVKLEKWWKFIVPLFGLVFLTQSILLIIAIIINYV